MKYLLRIIFLVIVFASSCLRVNHKRIKISTERLKEIESLEIRNENLMVLQIYKQKSGEISFINDIGEVKSEYTEIRYPKYSQLVWIDSTSEKNGINTGKKETDNNRVEEITKSIVPKERSKIVGYIRDEPDKIIDDETYLYLQNNTFGSFGRAIYLTTTPTNNWRFKEKYFNGRAIYLSSLKKVRIGYWYKLKDDICSIFFLNKRNEIIAFKGKKKENGFKIEKVNNPNVKVKFDPEAKIQELDNLIEYIDLEKIFNLGAENGLIFQSDHKRKRLFEIDTTEQNIFTYINKIYFSKITESRKSLYTSKSNDLDINICDKIYFGLGKNPNVKKDSIFYKFKGEGTILNIIE